MSLPAYLHNALSKIYEHPSKALRIFNPRYLRHFYWGVRFGKPTDLHKSRWNIGDDISLRKYRDYNEYRSHQASKIDDKSFRKRLESLEEEQYQGFIRRFNIATELAGKRTVLCLGARLGTEVRALKDMGHLAVGVDLNPGTGNVHVLCGDFHNIAFSDESFDAVYTNVLDHAFDLDKVMNEIKRLLRPQGIALIEIIRGTEEGYLPKEYEAVAWKTSRGFAEKLAEISLLRLSTFRSYEDIGDPFWSQAVLLKGD